MKYLFSLVFLLFLFSKAQAQGLIFDSTEFSKGEKIEETRAELPNTVSLKMYTPLLYPQVGSSCVAHSLANSRTILYARYMNWTDKNKITGLSFSPYYIYYRNKVNGDKGCSEGLSIELAAKDVLLNGIAPIVDVEYPNYYPFTDKALCFENDGSSYPPSMTNDLQKARNFKVDEIYRVTTVLGLKTALSVGMPVILCMYPPGSFHKVKGDLWTPQITDKIDPNSGHALIAVGYDDNKYGGAIELMNSWGDSWGNKGFTWVKYKDYLKWFLGGYALYVDNSTKFKSQNNSEFKPGEAKIDKAVMKVNSLGGKNDIKFNNAEFIKSFNKNDD